MRVVSRVAAAALAAAATLVTPVAHSAPARAEAARAGADWLAARQRSDGSFAQAERADLSADVLAAIVAGGVEGQVLNRALGYLAKSGEDGATRGAYTGRIIAGIVAAGGDPRDLGGTDYVSILEGQYDAASGAYDAEQLFPNLLAVNGALAAGIRVPKRAIDHIRANACADGGFGYDNGCTKGPDVDTTAWAINVFVAAGVADDDTTLTQARAFLLSAQRGDGGFGFTKSLATSADSTGLALTAIAALGEHAKRAPWRQGDGDDPVRALAKLQDPTGGFRFAPSTKPNLTSTTNAVPGMAAVDYPIKPGEGVGSPDTDAPTSDGDTTDASGSDKDDPSKNNDEPAPDEEAVAAGAGSPPPSADPSPTTSAYPLPQLPQPDQGGGDAQSFSAPDEAESGGSIPLWAFAAGIGALGSAGTGAGIWWYRRRVAP